MTTAGARLDTTVTGVGDLAGEFFADGIIVLFGDESPEELQEVAVVHRAEINEGGVAPGDVVTITGDDGDTTMHVLAVGDVANENLTNLGHLVLKRNGSDEAALPGDVCCDEGDIPAIGEGDRIVVAPSQEGRDG